MHSLSPADRMFRSEFETGTLKPAVFGHREHLRLAYVHIVEHGARAAATTFSCSLRDFLKRHEVDPGKYHETLTQAWLLAVRHFMDRTEDAECADAFLDRSKALLDRDLLLTHYSRERLFSEEARLRFVEPDLEPIPRSVGVDRAAI